MAGSASKKAGSGEKSRAEWDTAAEAILVEGLKEAVRNGQKSDNNFKNTVYQSISAELKKQGYNFDYKQVKSRWTRFKTAQKTVDTLLHKFSGFGWDDATKCVTASEKVWQAVLYDESGAKKKKFNEYNYFRSHPFLLYDEVTDIIGGATAKGIFAFSSTSTESPEVQSEGNGVNEGDEDGSEGPSEGVDFSQGSDGSVLEDFQTRLTPVRVPKPPATTSRAATPPASPISHKRHKSTSSTQIGSLCELVNRLVSGIVPSPRKTSGTPNKKFRAFQVVQAEERLSPHSLARARRVFRGGDDLADEYLSFDVGEEIQREARSIWLNSEMERLD